MDIRVSIPYSLGDKQSEILMAIYIGFSITGKEQNCDKETCWSVQLERNDGISSLNRWIGCERYNDEIITFSNYNNLMEFLKKLKKDVELAWTNYNKENKYTKEAYNGIKKLFLPLSWKEF